LNNKGEIVVKSSTKNLAIIRDYLEKELNKDGIGQSISNQIILAVDEACTNIIKHTYKFEDKYDIKLNFQKLPEKFVINIKYEGVPFNPNDVEAPNMKEYFAKYKVGGLGIPLIKTFMSKIEYSRIKPNTNSLTLIKELS